MEVGEERRLWASLLGQAAIRDEHLVLLVNAGPGLVAAFLASVNPGRLGSRAKRRDRTGVGLYAIEEDEAKRAEVWRLLDADLPHAYEGRVLGDRPERFPATVAGGFDRALLVAHGLGIEATARRVLCVYFLLGPGGRLVASVDRAALADERLARWGEINGAEVSCPEGEQSAARVLVVDR